MLYAPALAVAGTVAVTVPPAEADALDTIMSGDRVVGMGMGVARTILAANNRTKLKAFFICTTPYCVMPPVTIPTKAIQFAVEDPGRVTLTIGKLRAMLLQPIRPLPELLPKVAVVFPAPKAK